MRTLVQSERIHVAFTLYKSDADRFRAHVRDVHKIPQDADTWKEFGVRHVSYDYNRQGYYEPLFFGFKNGSWWRVPDDTTSTDLDEQENKEVDLREELLDLDGQLAEAKRQRQVILYQLCELDKEWFILPGNREARRYLLEVRLEEINYQIQKIYAQTTEKQRELHKLKFGKDK